MISGFYILTYLLFVYTTLAVQPSRHHARLARRRGNRQSQPSSRVESTNADSMSTNSTNWAGAVWSYNDGTFINVTGSFTVPIPGGNEGSAASAWVGIDGSTCTTAILQTGVDFAISDGGPVYSAWYEWYPAFASDFSGISISPGDNIRLTVTAFSANSGQATVENLSNGQTVTESLASGSALCQKDAEWIVEDFSENGSLVTLTNFRSVAFVDAFASDGNGILFDPSGASMSDIMQNNQMLTYTYAIGSSVTVEYVGS